MARKRKNEDDGILLGFEDAFNEYTEDLLAKKNETVLASFGQNASSPKSEKQPSGEEVESVSPLEALRAKMMVGAPVAEKAPEEEPVEQIEEPKEEKAETEEPKELSLLEKIKRYTTDESGHDVAKDESTSYTLESVMDIIKKESDSFIIELSEKYDVTVDNLGKPPKDDYLLKGLEEKEEKPAEEPKPETQEKPANTAGPTPTPEFEKLANESKQRFEKSLFDDIFPSEEEPKEKEEKSVPDISDIDNLNSTGDIIPAKANGGATVRFTPVVDKATGHTGRINISSSTKPLDIKQELTNISESEEQSGDTSLEMSDFDLYLPKDEITDLSVAKAEIRRLS
ncbi:MAG: hypothetical protein J6T73_02185, partial [Clostridia bacterium]|nr:hypothetical protein [Clostridia bacterium]